MLNEIALGKEKFIGKTILCLGDSITSDYSDDNTSWCEMLRVNLPVKEVINYGKAGTTITKFSERDDSFYERYQDMQSNADVIIVYGGINDFNHSLHLGELLSEDETTFYGALNLIIKDLLKRYPSADLMFITPMHAFGFKDYPHWATENENGHVLKDYRDAIMQTCQWYSVPVLDLFHTGGVTPDVQEAEDRMLIDGLHPGLEGRKRLARKLMQFLIYQL